MSPSPCIGAPTPSTFPWGRICRRHLRTHDCVNVRPSEQHKDPQNRCPRKIRTQTRTEGTVGGERSQGEPALRAPRPQASHLQGSEEMNLSCAVRGPPTWPRQELFSSNHHTCPTTLGTTSSPSPRARGVNQAAPSRHQQHRGPGIRGWARPAGVPLQSSSDLSPSVRPRTPTPAAEKPQDGPRTQPGSRPSCSRVSTARWLCVPGAPVEDASVLLHK